MWLHVKKIPKGQKYPKKPEPPQTIDRGGSTTQSSRLNHQNQPRQAKIRVVIVRTKRQYGHIKYLKFLKEFFGIASGARSFSHSEIKEKNLFSLCISLAYS